MAEKYKAIWLSPEQAAYFERKGIVIKEFLLKHFPDMPADKTGGSPIAVIVDGIEYESMQAAATALGVSRQAIHQRASRFSNVKIKNKDIDT